MSLVRRRNNLSVLQKISNIRFCNNRTAIPFSVCEWSRCRYRINRACTRVPGGLSRGPLRIVTIAVALVLCLLNDPPLYAASKEMMMIHNFHRDSFYTNGDHKEYKHYSARVFIDSENLGIGQEFTTGPNRSGYRLTSFTLNVNDYSDNVLDIGFKAAIYTADDNGRSRFVSSMNLRTTTIRKDDEPLTFEPWDGEEIRLQPDTRYMFTLECVFGCDDGENGWVAFNTAKDNFDNDHVESTQWQWGTCIDAWREGARKCKKAPRTNWNGWKIKDNYVKESDGWVHDGENEKSLILKAKAKFLFTPPTPTNFTAVPVSGDAGEVFLTWNSPQQPEIEWPEPLTGPCCFGSVPDRPGPPQEITHHQYRYKLVEGGQQWGEWTTIDSSGAGELYANNFTVTGLTNGVPYDLQVWALNDDGPSPPSDTARAEPGVASGICDRTPEVRRAFVRKVSEASDCAEVTGYHLARLTGRIEIKNSLETLQEGDFDGLVLLAALDLSGGELSELPAGIFDDLRSLTALDLSDHRLTDLSASEFDHFTTLERLLLHGNRLTGLPTGFFDGMQALQVLNLNDNRLAGGLPEGIFAGLSTLREIWLRGNSLADTDLTSDIFEGLSALQKIDLSNNSLTELPDGIFAGLTNLDALYLDRNSESPMILSVYLETDERSGVKAVAPAGAPFDIAVPVNVANGSLAGGADTITIPTGAVESEYFALTSVLRTPQEPDAQIDTGELQDLGMPSGHIGYRVKIANEQSPIEEDLPTFSITDAVGDEGDEKVEFTITLSKALAQDARVRYATSIKRGQTATSGTDFYRTIGSKLFIAGTTSKTISIRVIDDDEVEPDETFTVRLSDPPLNAKLDDDMKSAVGTILDDDGLPRLSIADASAGEGDGTVDFTVTLSETLTEDVTVQYSTSVASGQTATSGTDFTAVTGSTATITAGAATTTASIPIIDDTDEEGDETFTVTLSAPSTNARLAPEPLISAIGTIRNDDDTTAPAFDEATVDGVSLVIAFNEALAAAPNLANGAFTVKEGSVVQTLAGSPSIDGKTVTLTLATAVTAGDTGITVSYDVPGTDSNNRLEDGDGNEVANFTDQAVTNATPPGKVTGVSVSPSDVSLTVTWAAVPGATGYTVQWKSGDETFEDAGATSRERTVSGGNTLTDAIPDLTAGIQYTVRVIAVKTDVDDGPPSDEVKATPPVPVPVAQEVAADWSLIPSGLVPGEEFRLLFVTSAEYQATSVDIGHYDELVQERAAAGHEALRSYSGQFRVLGSTETVSARAHTGTTGTGGEPIYWLQGRKLADDYGDFYDGSWDNRSRGRNESGESEGFFWVWTGSSSDGSSKPGRHLGAERVRYSRHGRGELGGSHESSATSERRLYGLSGVFRVEISEPTLVTSVVTGDELVLTYDEALDEASVPEASAYTVKVDGTAVTLVTGTPVAISGKTVTLTLATAAQADDEVTVSYAKPETDPVQDLEGTDAEDFMDRAVTNAMDTTAPMFASATVDGTSLVITFDEALAAASKLANSAFMVKKTPSGGSEQTVSLTGTPSVSGKAVTLTLAAAVASTDTNVKVIYTKPDTDDNNRLKDASGNQVNDFTETVDNILDTTAPMFASARVNGASLEIIFDEVLAAASLANSAFTVNKTPSGGSEQTVSLSGTPSISGATLTLTLASAVVSTDTDVKVSYDQPATGTGNKLQDASGNKVRSFAEVVDNELDTTAPAFDEATVDGTSLVITFDETLAAASELANSAFMVKKTPSEGSEQTVGLTGTPSVSGKAVTLTLAAAVASTDTNVKVIYTKPDTDDNNRLEDASGNEVNDFTETVDNILDTTAPMFGDHL